MPTQTAQRQRDDSQCLDNQPVFNRLHETRERSLELAQPLSAEDQVVQAMDDASPTKWHLAHTTWFFETFLLLPNVSGYKVFNDDFHYCFNSYYEGEGPRHPRPMRGLLTRPTVDEVRQYRAHVDAALHRAGDDGVFDDPEISSLVELGIYHEEQHQELLLTDILALFARNPLRPAYREAMQTNSSTPLSSPRWVEFEGGIYQAGHSGTGFCFDNEMPRHEVLIQPFALADRLVTNREWSAFMDDGGYRDPALWLSDGWSMVQQEKWDAPLYSEHRDGCWRQMSLRGLLQVDPDAPVRHVSFYEADAFARWSGKRLPSEFEWEIASVHASGTVNDLSSGALMPQPLDDFDGESSGPAIGQMFGDVWEWTASAYLPYPGFRTASGSVGEYNGKFMVNQHVLRGGSCTTVAGHSRSTYRNFFYPFQRWQFTGLRLAEDRR